MKKYSSCKIIDGIARQLIKAGWFIKSKNRHLRLENPETKQCITVPGSPSDKRATLNWIHHLKNSGVEVCF